MYTRIEKPKENQSRAIANSVRQKKSSGKKSLALGNNKAIQFAQISPSKANKEAEAAAVANQNNDDPGLLKSPNHLKDWQAGETAKTKWRIKSDKVLNGYTLEHIASDSITYPTAIDLKYREKGQSYSWLVYHVPFGKDFQ